jgi:hypothetical protein
MIYTLEFLGLLAVALSLVASRVLADILERFFSPIGEEDRAAAGSGWRPAVSNDRSSDRADMRDEIRRVTQLLESGQLDALNVPMVSRPTMVSHALNVSLDVHARSPSHARSPHARSPSHARSTRHE